MQYRHQVVPRSGHEYCDALFDPPHKQFDLTNNEDPCRIGNLTRPQKGSDFEWVKDKDGELVVTNEFSWTEMMAEPRVRMAVLEDEDEETTQITLLDVSQIWIQCIDCRKWGRINNSCNETGPF